MADLSMGNFYQLAFYDKFKHNLYSDSELRNIITIRELKILMLIQEYNKLHNDIGITLPILSAILDLEVITLNNGKLPLLIGRKLIYWIHSIKPGKMKYEKLYHLTGKGRRLLNLIALYYSGYYTTLHNRVVEL